MSVTHHTPKAPLKTLAALARWTLWVVASIWLVLIMVWGGLHFLIVPRIADFRPMLEQQASRVLGVKVRVGAVMALSNGLIPSLEFRDVSLSDANDREALRLPSVLAALSPRSLLSLGFEQVYVAAPVLDVRRSRDGRFWVAGLPLSATDQTDGIGADWLFSQTELVVRQGTVNWTDELRGAPVLALSGVDLVLRNKHRRHTLRLDVSPPAHWGERIQVMGDFKQGLFTHRAGQWRDWEGQLYGNFSQVDLSHLRQYVDLGVDVARGSGALRAWVDVKKGVVTGATADLALRDARVQVAASLEPLAMQWAAGRLGAKFANDDVELFTQALEFDTPDGLRWPGGNLRVNLRAGKGGSAPRGELVADKLDVAAMAQIADRLPLPESIREALQALRPKGLVSHLQMGWSGPLESAGQFTARGAVQGLAVSAWGRPQGTTPGITGAQVDFDINQAGGKLKVEIRDGSLDLAGFLDQPLVSIDHLTGNVSWKTDGQHMGLSASDVRWTNADGQGDLQFKWQTSPAATAKQARADTRFPGILDLQANFSKVQANQVHRYLPVGIEQPVRTYLKEAIVSGSVTAAKIKIKGPLALFPFADAKQGDFQVLAGLQDVVFAYGPASLMSTGSLPWPSLTQLSGELTIDHSVLQVKGAHAAVAGLPGLQVTRADAEIRNLYGGATLAVTAEARGPLADIVTLVNNSPLSGMTAKALSRATASGLADYRFKLGIPLAAMDRAVVQGAIGLLGNDIQITPETPKMARARGAIVFSENGFGVNGGQVRALGGEARIEGVIGAVVPGPKPGLQGLRIQGTATAEGLRQARELGVLARLAQYGSGSAGYSATLGARGLVSELVVQSNLVGMAVALPAPFTKTAEAALPLRMESSMLPNAPLVDAGGKVREQDQLKLDIGRIASVVYQRDVSGSEPRVLRGAIAVGLAADESAPLPDEGVIANVNTPQIDLDAWSSVLAQSAGADPTSGALLAGSAVAQGYLPNILAVRAQGIVMGGRKLRNVALGGGRDGLLWRANLSADELNGYVEYRQPSGAAAGRLFARLARLTIGPGTAQEVETLLDEQPASIPALDIVVEDFELRGKKLGRIDIDAVNLAATNNALKEAPREWRLNRFNITTPEAVFAATGNWTNIVALVEPTSQRPVRERRRTALKFKLDINDAGALLERFGMPGVVRSGAGKIEGRIGWLGSPITFDYASLGGDLNVNVENGQFLKTDPGIARLLGVLSLQSLPRRLALDFRDVFSDGFAFDFFRGDVAIVQGLARTTNLQMKGVTAAVVMEGQADIARETQNLKVVVVPEINAGSASLLASYINPIWGLSSFLAQLIVRKPLMDSLTQEFLIDGTWLEPRVTKMERK
ncbi:MAG: TIGR02099 family protein [Burkholderiales bacterium PBB3]|nr:MAG: TIGR02099 family protein [Burkholderiales bacterium PBB3]